MVDRAINDSFEETALYFVFDVTYNTYNYINIKNADLLKIDQNIILC